MRPEEKQSRLSARARRTHAMARVSGRPRLIVVKSNKAIAAHIMDDEQGKVVCGVSSLKLKSTGAAAAAEVGKAVAEKAKKLKISKVSFDRNGRQYHGQVKALADAARDAGLEF